MWRRLWITLATGTALTGAYLGYSALISPAIRVRVQTAGLVPAAQSTTTARPSENLRIAETWMKHRPWAAKAQKTLWTKEMYIFADDWTPRGEQGQVRFRPFAGVWIAKNKQGEEEAFTVTAESALLQFESKFDLDHPQPGRVTGGTLDGQVEIDGPDGLKISGENFYFSEGTSSIFSPKGNHRPVKFQFGENKGTAGGMTIRLIKGDRPVSKDRPNVIGVESVELSQNPRMELKLDDDPKSQPVIVKCTDTFKYHVESQTAVFDKHVIAYQKQAKKPAEDSAADQSPATPRPSRSDTNRLRCDRLTVQFEPKPGVAAAAKAATGKRDDEYQQIERNLQFRSLKAEGQKVMIASGQDLMAAMTLLTYDAPTRTIQMRHPQAVIVKQGLNQLQCPNIRLVLGPGNSLAEAVCEGTGWLETFDKVTGEIAFAADWMKQLRKTADPETQLDLVELQQDASFRQPARDTGLVADVIRLWFTPLENADAEGPSLDFGGTSGTTDPKRLLALKSVVLLSPQLEAETNQLEVVFDEEPNAASPKDKTLSGRSRRHLKTASAYRLSPLAPVSGERARERGAMNHQLSHVQTPVFISTGSRSQNQASGSVRPLSLTLSPAAGARGQSKERPFTAAFASVPPEGSDTGEAAPKPPMMVAADRIRVRMLKPEAVEATPEVREIWTIGRVRVEQPAAEGDGSLVVTGSKLHVENYSETDQIVHVYGEPNRPAIVRDEQQQLHIEGELIHLDRAENLAWVEGAGLLQMPVKESLDGQVLDEPQLLDVWWRERMDFDGLLATFDGDVRVKLAEVRMECQSMQVALASKLKFTAASAAGEPPKLSSITCRDNVKFENRRYLENRLMEIQIARAFEFHLDYSTQHANAKGPGWMQMWQRRKGTRPGLAAANSVKANSTSNEPQTEWEYSRVDFFGRMEGQIDNRRTTLYDRVEVLHGPVLKPMDEFDQHHIPQGGGYMQCKKLELVQTKPAEDGRSFVQLLGAGNTRLEGSGFSGKADTISYDEAKGLFILHSLGDRKATIYRTNARGEQEPSEGQHLEFHPVIKRVRWINATGAVGSWE